MPPSYLSSITFSFVDLLSIKLIFTPVFKNASSRSLFSIVLKLNSILVKVSDEGKKVIFVPVVKLIPFLFVDTPISFNCELTKLHL